MALLCILVGNKKTKQLFFTKDVFSNMYEYQKNAVNKPTSYLMSNMYKLFYTMNHMIAVCESTISFKGEISVQPYNRLSWKWKVLLFLIAKMAIFTISFLNLETSTKLYYSKNHSNCHSSVLIHNQESQIRPYCWL